MDDTFIPITWTILNWGGVPVPKVTAAPELSAYSEPPYYTKWDRVYTPQQLEYLMSDDYNFYGASNLYNSMRLYGEYKAYILSGVAPGNDSYMKQM